MEYPTINFMDLPVEMIDKIISYLSYDNIAKIRQVNKTFNNICSDKLNSGFVALEKFHRKCMKAVKSELPRRESERKHHPLARNSDILMAVETRFSMLSMTFTKYIEMHQCCFIPGKVLDEAFRVLRIVNKTSSPDGNNYSILPRPYEFLQEYRDISSMAMEHFDDKILPIIRERMRIENSPMYCYKNKLSRLQFVRMGSLKTNGIQSYNTSNPTQPSDNLNNVKKWCLPTVKLVNKLQRTIKRCNCTHKAFGIVHRKMIIDSNKVRSENNILKRKCHQMRCGIKLLKKDLAETKITVSAMAKEINQLKLQQSSPSGVRSIRDKDNKSDLKLHKLLRHTNLKYNSTNKTVDGLRKNMKIMAKRIGAQERLLKQTLLKGGCSNQEPIV